MSDRQLLGAGIFVAVNSMRGNRRKCDEVKSIRAVFAERDRIAPLEPYPLPPSFTVETSPDGRGHDYWVFEPEDTLSLAEFNGVMITLVELYGSDPNAKDAARVLRLPGTRNLKFGRSEHPVRIVSGEGERYARAMVLSHYPPRGRPHCRQQDRPGIIDQAPQDLERFHEPLKAIEPDDYGTWLRVGQALHYESEGGPLALLLWDQWSARSEKWTPGVCVAKWKTFGRPGVTGRMIFALAKRGVCRG